MSEDYKHPYLSAFSTAFKSCFFGDLFYDSCNEKLEKIKFSNKKYFSFCKYSGRALGIISCVGLGTLPFYIASVYKILKKESSESETSDLINPLNHSNPGDSLEKTITDFDKINSQP